VSAPEDADADRFADLPSTDVAVEAHVHFGMTGSFPLRLAELFFADDGLYVAEYSYITPLFGLGTRKHRREAQTMQAVYDVHGLDEVLLQADSVVWHSYANLDRVVLHEGGRLGRSKITVEPREGTSHAYRLHDEADFEALAEAVGAACERRDVSCERREGLGFTPRESVRRFFSRS
jgi:hypothetical protein